MSFFCFIVLRNHFFVLFIMQMIGALDYGMAKIADLMMKHVLVPAISSISVAVNVEILDEGSPKHYVSVLRIVPSEEQKVSIL
jgi:protein transport protein DSL1/ZW10